VDLVETAVQVIQRDGLVVYPTDTVYGLGGDALSDEAIEKVFEAKGRDLSTPISVAVADIEMLAALAHVDSFAEEFIGAFLPGPVTVVLMARNIIPALLTGGTGMIGLRIPAHEVPLRITSILDGPITATSANRSGAPDPRTAAECHVPHDLLLDYGPLPGTPSTVVDLVNRTVIRPGVGQARVREFLATHE
jgi:L-threonylcarbamoyladenylate synthase